MSDDAGVLQDDLRELLALLGMDDGARPQSPHEVFQECLTALRKKLTETEHALSKLAIEEHLQLQMDGVFVPVENACTLCGGRWLPEAAQVHAESCLLTRLAAAIQTHARGAAEHG